MLMLSFLIKKKKIYINKNLKEIFQMGSLKWQKEGWEGSMLPSPPLAHDLVGHDNMPPG